MDSSPLSTAFPVEPLLPLRAAAITLRFLTPAQLPFFHQPALTAFLRNLLDSPEQYDLYLTLDAPESGRTLYQAGDGYGFTLLALAGGEALLQTALDRLRELPASARRLDKALPFRDNLAFGGARDLFREQPAQTVSELFCYDAAALEREAALWRQAPWLRLRWRSPVRLLRDKTQREGAKGEARYCRNRADLSFALLADRLHDTLADLLRRRSIASPLRGPAPAAVLSNADLFWADCRYRDEQGSEQLMGGLLGTVELDQLQVLPADTWRLWVLGQYLGIGQRRAFGWGRYQLETAAGDSTAVHSEPAASLLERAVVWDNLKAAYAAIRANQTAAVRRPPLPEEDDAWAWDSAAVDDDEAEIEEEPVERLQKLAAQLTAGRYQSPPLNGVIVREADGDLRPLAIPPFFDRVAQRAVAQVLTPALEPLMYHGSFGYRLGRSRQNARHLIQAAYQEGYRWVYEADIEDFFDSVDWNRLRNRLTALYGDDPLVTRVLAWVTAPVVYENQTIQRSAGLPQGSPLSPLLANLMLDDFDSDLESAGFRLARFADDFVILCKDREQAEAAAQAVVASLEEQGLRINPAKTAIRTFNQGFRYLGYLFVNGMALDVSGKRAEQAAAKPAAPPPGSWLAKLLRQSPRALEADKIPPNLPSIKGGIAGNASPPSKEEAASALQLGEEAPEGTLLFITGPPALLTTGSGRLQVERDGQTLLELPWQRVQGIVLLGAHHISTPALRTALEQEVPIHFASRGGRYQGVTWSGQPGPEGLGLWLQQQTCFADPANALEAARRIVEARLRHSREVLRQRDLEGQGEAGLHGIDQLLEQLAQAADLSVLNGLEGQGARLYFEALQPMVPAEFGFTGRNRRPPRDPFNALLSLGYTILFAQVDTVLRADGLLPWVGFYHQAHGRHAVLASDLMEPFRHLVERTALAAVTRRRLRPEDFYLDAERGCLLQQEAMKRYLAMLSERFDTPLLALNGEIPKTLHGHLHEQNLALIAWIRGKAPGFTAWRMR